MRYPSVAHHFPTMTKSLKRTLQIIIPLTFGILILWLLYRNVDMQSIMRMLRSDANWTLIIISCLMGTLGNVFRGLRWQILLRTVDPRPTLRDSMLCVHGNYAVNMAFPRLGEVWRCGMIAHYAPMPFTKAFGTVLVDRSFDILMILLIVLCSMLVNFPFFRSFFTENPDLMVKAQKLTASVTFYLLIGLLFVLMVAGWWFLRRKGYWHSFHTKLHGVWEGILSMGKMKRKWSFGIYTLLIWSCYFMQMYIPFGAFSFTQGFSIEVALLAFSLACIAVAAPVQAGMGAWHFMVIYTLMSFGIGHDDAAGFALIVHTTQTLWTTLVGLIAMALLPLVQPRTKAPISAGNE